MVSIRISMEQSLKCREVGLKWLYIGIECWPKDTKSDAFGCRAVTAVTASDFTCPADGVSFALMSTLLYRIAFAPA